MGTPFKGGLSPSATLIMKKQIMINNELLLTLQKGIPLEEKPFDKIADSLRLKGKDIVDRLQKMFDSGSVRRIGAIFDYRRLGYKSSLCALYVKEKDLDSIAAKLTPNSGITHCYLRGWPEELDKDLPEYPGNTGTPNLWFTFSALSENFDSELNEINKNVEPYKLLSLPACRRFKIDVIFDTRTRDRSEKFPGAVQPETKDDSVTEKVFQFSEKEKFVIQRLQGNLPLVENPFNVLAEELGWQTGELLALLNKWKESGILRRMALIVYHRNLGFKANAMCVWQVGQDNVIASGRKLAANREVTHCYQRILTEGFPYNLFAMIHSGDWECTRRMSQKISKSAELENGKVLFSIHEYKKTSPKYFFEKL